MPCQSEAGHVGCRAHACGDARFGCGLVQLHHSLDHRAQVGVGFQVRAQRRVHDAGADRLRVIERISRERPAVAHHFLGVHQAEHRQAVLRFVVFDGMPANHERPGFTHLVRAAAQNLADDLGAHAAGEGQDVERRDRARAHGEHVRERVGGGDRAVFVGVVDHRCEEVEREHGCVVLVNLIDGGVVGGVESEQDVRVGHGRRDVLQDFREVARTPFRSSTALVRERGQPDAVAVVDGAVRYALVFAHGILFAGGAVLFRSLQSIALSLLANASSTCSRTPVKVPVRARVPARRYRFVL